MSPTFAEGTVRVSTPASYDATPAAASTVTKGLPDPADLVDVASRDVLVAALEGSDLHLVETVDLTPRRTKDLDAPRRKRTGAVELEVDVPVDEDAVVLLERDGVYSWHLPVDTGRRTKDLTPGPRTRRFEIAVTTERRDRGLLGNLVQGAAQALVFRFVAPVLLEKAVERMEAHVRPGLVHLRDAEVSSWRRVESLDELHLPTDRPVRVLLLVHGTFSSTVGAFGAMAVDENGGGFLRAAIAAYDAVIGFDHKTLSVDPQQNAEALLKRLKKHRPGAELVIDVITHSRGGLVTRSFVEQVLPSSGWPATVDNIVFVAATNAGTHLADPERWSDLVDLYTNLAVVSARVLTAVGAGPVAAVVGGVVKGIGAFVKYLVSYAAEGDDVPGLKAMVPGGAFVTEINRLQPGQPGPGTHWFVVSSHFHVSLFDDHHNPPEFPRELVAKLKEGFVDQLFEGDNDLVVDTASMSAIGPPDGGFVSASFDLGENDVVYHNNYFTQLPVIEAIAGWLPLGLGAGGGPEMAEMEMADVAMAAPPEPPQEYAAARSAAPSPPPTMTEATLAAEMPAHVVTRAAYDVRVRLSRGAIEATAGAVSAEVGLLVEEDRPLSVQVVGKANATISGDGIGTFELETDGATSELTFTVSAPAPGPCVVTIIVKQGSVHLARMSLTATAVAKADVATMPRDTTATAEAHPGIDAPELEGLPCIDIYERRLTKTKVSYHYAVRLERGQPVLTFESAPVKDREKTVGKILDDVARIWKDTDAQPRERERKLQDIGTRMFDELFPPDLQAHLWRKRAKVKDLIVYADEPFVPWELVHLKPPTGPREEKPRFLAQHGLVRWQPGSFPPKELRVGRDRARSLVPSYKDPQFALTEPVHEQEFLADRFAATKVTATPTGVRTLLRSGDFDLLHFSGHGAADPADIGKAKLLLQGLKRSGTVHPQYVGAATVSENAAWARAGTGGPLVVLNACQVGQAGDLLTTVGGFAQAFLDAGASAFISCLWSVHQQPSRIFVERLYDELLAGAAMSTATTRAREAARKAGDPTWLAFVVYARPDAVLVTD